MNPFDLRGPEFLLFYFVFSAVILLILVFLRQRDERRDAEKPLLTIPTSLRFFAVAKAKPFALPLFRSSTAVC